MRARERERTSGLSQSMRVFFFHLFHVIGLVLRRRNGTEKNTVVEVVVVVVVYLRFRRVSNTLTHFFSRMHRKCGHSRFFVCLFVRVFFVCFFANAHHCKQS